MSDTDDVKLKEHIQKVIELKFDTMERILVEREKALNLTAQNLEHRLAHLNSLRDDVLKDRNLFVSKLVYDEMHKAIADRIEKVESFQAKMIGVGSAMVVVAGILGAVITHIFTK